MVRKVKRVDDQGLFDSSNAQEFESGWVEEGGGVHIPGITGKYYRIASQRGRLRWRGSANPGKVAPAHDTWDRPRGYAPRGGRSGSAVTGADRDVPARPLWLWPVPWRSAWCREEFVPKVPTGRCRRAHRPSPRPVAGPSSAGRRRPPLAPVEKISAACSAVRCGPSKACNDAVSRVSAPALAIGPVECRGRQIARSTEYG
jgi:hypothetical protein